MKKLSLLVSSVVCSVFFSSVVYAKPVNLKAITYMPINKEEDSMGVFKAWVDELDRVSNGEMKVTLIGGPEVFSIGDQVNAASKGLVDLVVTFTPHADIVPEVNTLGLSDITPQEEREVGYTELLDKSHEKINLKYIGRVTTDSGFFIFSKKPIETLSDFENLKIRSHSGYDSIFSRVNAMPVGIGVGEIYSALERSVVDAAPYNLFVHDMGISEVTEYVLANAFWPSHTTSMLMNLKKYNSLTDQQRAWIDESYINIEKEMPTIVKEMQAQEIKRLEDAGMVFISLPEDEAEEWARLTQEARFEDIKERFPEGRLEQIKEMIVRD